MKRALFAGMVAVAGFVGFAATPAAAQQATKIAYVNTQKVLAEAPGSAEAQKTLNTEMESYRAELQKMETELDSLQQSLNKQQATMTAAAKQAKEQELQQKFQAYQQRRAQLEQTAQQRQQQLAAPIMKKISDVIDQMRKQGNYAVILDATTVISADTTLDLTDEVLARLKAAPAGK